MAPSVAHPDEVTAEWMTQVLRGAGVLPEGSVTKVEVELVGTGQVADSARISLTYDHVDGPSSVVAKFPSEDATSRSGAASTRTYEVETRFYQQLRDRVHIRTPRPYFADIDLASLDYVVVLEDMAPAAQGDQLAGCDADTCALALEEAALLHAPVWDAPDLRSWAWLNRSSPEAAEFTTALLTSLYPGFVERYESRLDPEVVQLGAAIMDRLGDYLSVGGEPLTAVHGDYRLDNMLFGDGKSAPRQTTVDWQTVTLGQALGDVAYFMGTSPLPEVRRADEEELVREYHRALLAGGVEGFDWNSSWAHYRRLAFSGLLMAIGASMLVKRTDRGDDMFMAMAQRSARMASDLESLSVL